MDCVSSNPGSTWKKKDLFFFTFPFCLGFRFAKIVVKGFKISTQSSFRDDDREAKGEGSLLQVLIVRIYASWKSEIPNAYLHHCLYLVLHTCELLHSREGQRLQRIHGTTRSKTLYIHESAIHCYFLNATLTDPIRAAF
jgi:hypothetical protein